MKLLDAKTTIPSKVYDVIEQLGLPTLRPSQFKAIEAGLFDGKNLLVCTPTASGKTLVGEMAMLDAILNKGKKALYLVPLKALASEKHISFLQKYPQLKIAKSVGDTDSAENYLEKYDLIITTTEKLDSLLRHHAAWISQVGVCVVDEVHLLNDQSRGPTLEVVLTILMELLPALQLIALSATIGNAPELASWLRANLVVDHWRPSKLHHGVYVDGEITFYRTQE
jgi:helicase